MNIKRPSDNLPNVKCPSDGLIDGYSIFEYQISILPSPICIFDIRMSNIHLTTSQMDIRYSNIKRPSDGLTDGYSTLEYQMSI